MTETDNHLLFSNCPFCGHQCAKMHAHDITRKVHVPKFGIQYQRYTKFYVRCMICNARGPLANSRSLAEQFWNYTNLSDHHTKSWHFEDLRYKTK